MEVNQNEDGDLIYSSGDVLTYLGLSINGYFPTYHISPVFSEHFGKTGLVGKCSPFCGAKPRESLMKTARADGKGYWHR